MKANKYLFFVLIALSLSGNAEVFKCKQVKGKIVYQSEPCPSGAAIQKVIKVKEMTPEQAEEARIKLEAWKQQQAADDAAKYEAQKQRQAELEKQESLELQRRSVIAQEKQAIAEQQRQERRNRPIVIPPYGYGRYWGNPPYPPFNRPHPNMPHDHQFHSPGMPPLPPQQPAPLPVNPPGKWPLQPEDPDKPRPGLLRQH